MSRLNDLRLLCRRRRLSLTVRIVRTFPVEGEASEYIEVFVSSANGLDREEIEGSFDEAIERVRKRWPAKGWDTRRARQRAEREQADREGRRRARQERVEAEYRMARGAPQIGGVA